MDCQFPNIYMIVTVAVNICSISERSGTLAINYYFNFTSGKKQQRDKPPPVKKSMYSFPSIVTS